MPQLNTFAIIIWSFSLFIGVLALGMFLWASRHGQPIPFWSGGTIRPEELIDVPAYNRANGIMWAVYALGLALAGVFALFSILAGVIALVVAAIPGGIILILVNKRIYNQYKSETGRYRIEI